MALERMQDVIKGKNRDCGAFQGDSWAGAELRGACVRRGWRGGLWARPDFAGPYQPGEGFDCLRSARKPLSLLSKE